ncbi:MAG: aspartate-semialdehyde dehydrogenase [Elusimicrobiota bacterium]|nr:aspartate-semialdehyde dehydrogenase [Endomicrobiia bacterium]MDW8165910.1 aspartate-semialdehyde dehydrogenase [Elusimicrobiota bacterium]
MTFNIAVVGATGAVGQEMLRMLEVRNFPVKKIYPFASSRSKGKKILFKNQEYEVIELTKENVKKYSKDIQLALFSAGASVSKEYAPIFAEDGIFVVDNSSAWRMEPEIPLVVPEVNPHTLAKDKKIIANPNCSTIQMVVVLAPIHKVAKIKRIIVSTYQSTSGAGGKAMLELYEESKAVLSKLSEESLISKDNSNFLVEKKQPSVFPVQIGFNLIPQIDIFLQNLYTKEEMKMVNETKKILEDESIKISAQCVRVPVFRAHSESVWIETEKKVSVQQAKEILASAKGVKVLDDPFNQDASLRYPTPIEATSKQITYVGRIREDLSCENGLVMWIVSDNLLKGAALNAVEILEELLYRKII